jgi:hypothetical protein
MRQMMRFYLLILFILQSNLYAQNLCEQEKLKSYNPISGTIPLAFGHMPATDLVCDSNECGTGLFKGDVLLPQEAADYYHRRFQETRCQWTLADLNPQEEEGVWQNNSHTSLIDDENALPIQDLDSVQFVSEGWARLGSYRLTVNKNNHHGVPLQYTIILSKNVHNYLLRKTLLRKLGYYVPAVKHVKRIRITFDTENQKKEFIKNLSVNNAGSFDRWVLSEKKKEVVVQDIIVMEDQEFSLNLAKGYLSPDIFQGKRVYTSLLLPFALTEAPESINMFDWTIGRIYSENVALQYPNARDFNPSYEDAVWMVRRLSALSENDWREIAASANLPASVELLLFEKLKSRRNHLAHLFGVENFNLPVNGTISNQDDLVDGKLMQEFYDGYARRFKIPDPESPLSYSEMVSFFKSKAISTGMEMLVNSFNSSRFMGTDISAKVTEFNQSLAQNVATTLTSGESTKTPVASFLFPTVQGNLVLNREILAGSYLGTDNLIQLVDTVGASVSVGVFGGLTGVYSKTGALLPDGQGGSFRQFVPVELTANSQLFLNRTYAHVKPITSVQKALKYPFKNMLVPMLKNQYGHYFDALMNTDYDKLSDEDKNKINQASFKLLDDKIQIVSKSLKSIPKDAQSTSVEGALANLVNQKESLKPLYLEAKGQDQVAMTFLSAINAYKLSFSANYVTVTTCADKATKKITKYFSLMENAQGQQVFCASSAKQKLFPAFVHAEEAIAQIEEELIRHHQRLAGKEAQKDTEEVMTLLNENLEIGESIIITDTIGGSLTANVGGNLYNVVNVRMSTRANKILVNRLHIHRSSANEIHVYKDLGNLNGIELALSVQKFIPIMKITFKATAGSGRTKFYKVNMGDFEDQLNRVPNLYKNEKLKGLRQVLLTGSVNSLESVEKPIVVTHKFNENDKKFGIFVWRWNKLNTLDSMIVTTPKGDEQKLFRRNMGKTQGRDIENYAKDLVDLLIGKIFNTQFSVTSFNEGNPGYTFMGKATNTIISYEGVYNSQGSIDRPYLKLNRIWNGWKLKKDKAIKILKDIKKKYQFRFFEEDIMAQTQELFLYNINVNFFVYDTGLKHMLNLPEDQVKKIWTNFQSRNLSMFSGTDILVRSGYHNFISLRKKYHTYLLENDLKGMSKTAMRLVEVLEENLVLSGIAQVLGGGTNFFAVGKIDGFRVGDENGDQKLLSNSFGRVGTEDIEGPIAKMRKFLGITHGEFVMSWLMGRVI